MRRTATRALVLTLLLCAGFGPIAAAGAQSGPAGTGEAVFGSLKFEDTAVSGAVVTVSTPDGEQIGEATSDEEGAWEIALPGPGRYRVTIVVETLPEDVSLRNPDRETLETTVAGGQRRPLAFLLGEGTSTGKSTAEEFAQATLNGVKIGLILAMASIGLSLIFGTTGLINFAHGELVAFGAVVAWSFNAEGPTINLIAAAAVAVALTVVVGIALERGLFLPLRRRRLGAFQFVVITIGLSLFARQLLQLWIGERRQFYRNYLIQDTWDLGPVSITPRDFTIMVLSLICLVAVATLLQRTRMGKATRAVADNPALASTSGIDIDRVTTTVWGVGAGLAALGGVFLGAVESVQFNMGLRLLLLIFAAVVLGGLGTAYGAMVGGLAIGLVTEISTVWVSSELKLVFALLMLVLVLLVRPSGILGVKERVG